MPVISLTTALALAAGFIAGVALMWLLRGRLTAGAVAAAEKEIERKAKRAMARQKEQHDDAMKQVRASADHQAQRLAVVTKVHDAERESLAAEITQLRQRVARLMAMAGELAPPPATAASVRAGEAGASRSGDHTPTQMLDP